MTPVGAMAGHGTWACPWAWGLGEAAFGKEEAEDRSSEAMRASTIRDPGQGLRCERVSVDDPGEKRNVTSVIPATTFSPFKVSHFPSLFKNK